MSKKIEILENTLLKLLVRRGADLDRKNITLSEGELGYTTDGKRLFVGDSQTTGGTVAGNKFHGIVADISVVTFMLPGDLVYVTTDKTLYARNAANTAWEVVSVVLEPSDGTIVIGDSQISVGTLSAGNFSDDMAGNSIEIDTNGRIALSSTQILTDQINTRTASHLKLPQSIDINNTEYEFPVGGVQNNTFLGTDASGNLSWKASDKSTSIFFNSSAAAIPVGAMVESGVLSAMPDGWLLADGQTVASSQFPDLYESLGTVYGGDATNFQLPDESANGFVFIKALPDEIAQSDVTFTNGLTATKDGVDVTGQATDTLNGSIEIGLPVPGVFVDDTASTNTFTTKATYTKFWLTGSGSRGGNNSGGAAATVTGILSAPIGTDIDYMIGAGVTTNNTPGNPSTISINGTEISRSFGALWQPSNGTGTTNTGTLSTTGTGLAGGESAYVLGGHIIEGGPGGWDTDGGGDEEAGATASFWGADGVAGAGSGSHGKASADTADGLVKFEWGM